MTEVHKKPALLLLPNLLGDQRHHELFLPASVDKAVATLDGLIAESEKGGRRYLGRFKTEKKPSEIPIAVFNKDTPEADLDFFLDPIKKGERWGLVSDAGAPCIADPGAVLVKRARTLGISIQAFVGPSAILLALMQSGLPGQKFYFHGYLDKNLSKRKEEILRLEQVSRKEGATQIFIETPHRNTQTLELLVNTLPDSVTLCAAWELTLPEQGILSQSVHRWKKSPLPNLQKKNAIFLLLAYTETY